jgi:hypothetical protein
LFLAALGDVWSYRGTIRNVVKLETTSEVHDTLRQELRRWQQVVPLE